MILANEYNHRGAKDRLQSMDLYTFVRSLVDAAAVMVQAGSAPIIKKHIDSRLREHGWAMPAPVRQGYNPSLNALHPDHVVLRVQTGNIARAFYDLLKMEAVFAQDRAVCGVLIVPDSGASRKMGGNLADFRRIRDELDVLYAPVISLPVLLLGFE